MELYSGGGKRKKTKKAKSGVGTGAKLAVAICAIAVAGIAAGSAMGVAAINRIDTVFPNVSLDGTEIGGMSDVELAKTLYSQNYESAVGNSVKVELPLDFTLDIAADEVCTETKVEDVVNMVMDACHEGSSLEVARRYIQCRLKGMELYSGRGLSVDSAAVKAKVENTAREVNLSLMKSDLTVGEDSIRFTKGASSVTIDTDEICSLVENAFQTGNYDTIVYDGQINAGDELDLDGVYEKIFSEPQDAYYDPETDSIVPEVRGVSFDMIAARNLWSKAQYGEEINIPLETTEPEVTEEMLSELLFRDCFCSKATSLYGSTSNRINNVTKAAASIDGMVLMPGEEFSYNDALGERTAENGYLTAGAYSGGETVQEYGGGICQVSSTLYYCAMHANLNITARCCHMFPVGYIPAGMDATVSWGGPEFKFVNDRDYPVRIVAYVEDNYVTVELWGTNVDGSYVEMTNGTTLVYDKEFTDVVIGYRAETYRNVYDKDGNLISRRLEAKSSYNYHPEDIQWPEESPEPTEEPTPEETPEPIETPEPEELPEPIEPSPEPEPAEPSDEPVDGPGETGEAHEPWLDAAEPTNPVEGT